MFSHCPGSSRGTSGTNEVSVYWTRRETVDIERRIPQPPLPPYPLFHALVQLYPVCWPCLFTRTPTRFSPRPLVIVTMYYLIGPSSQNHGHTNPVFLVYSFCWLLSHFEQYPVHRLGKLGLSRVPSYLLCRPLRLSTDWIYCVTPVVGTSVSHCGEDTSCHSRVSTGPICWRYFFFLTNLKYE